MTGYAPRVSVLIGLILGVVLLYAVAPKSEVEKRYEELALGRENAVALGTVSGVRVHCHDLDNIDPCLAGYAAQARNNPVVLWLGNSQVHAINRYRAGEETAAPEFDRMLQDQDRYFFDLIPTQCEPAGALPVIFLSARQAAGEDLDVASGFRRYA